MQRPDMTTAVDWDVKQQFNQTKRDTDHFKILGLAACVTRSFLLADWLSDYTLVKSLECLIRICVLCGIFRML